MTTGEPSESLRQSEFQGSPTMSPSEKAALGLAFIGLGLFIYTIAGYNYFLDSQIRFAVKLLLPFLLLGLTLLLRRTRLAGVYQRVSLAFFSVSMGFLLAWFFGRWYVLVPGLVPNTAEYFALAKLAEAMPITAAILVLCLLSGDTLQSFFLKGGNIAKGLAFGALVSPLALVYFMTMGGLSISVGLDVVLSWTPWLVLFALSNSIMEEVMFRGLFLKRLEPLFGLKGSLTIITIFFALFHVALIQFMGPVLTIAFVAFLLLEGWLWGLIIQKTGSIWGAVLAHAVADVFFLIIAVAA